MNNYVMFSDDILWVILRVAFEILNFQYFPYCDAFPSCAKKCKISAGFRMSGMGKGIC